VYLYETHLHTSAVSACATASPEAQARAYAARGYAGMIVTDHFGIGNCSCPRVLPWEDKMAYFFSGYERARREGAALGLDVYFGWEYCVFGTEFLTYGLDIDFLLAHPALQNLTPEEYSSLVRACGGYLAQAHPYRQDPWVRSPSPVDPRLLDGVEVFNASMPDDINRLAAEFAREHNLPAQAGSDSHREQLPFASGVALRARARSVFDIIDAVKTGTARLLLPQSLL
jgi:predicted metal-dependent phosphoesterase TrpH